MVTRGVPPWALLLVMIGSTSSTVYREVMYEDAACTTQSYVTDFFGIPDNFGLQDFGACVAGTDNTSSYIEYECINSTVVAVMYSDGICTDAMESITSAEVTSELCTSNVITSCSTTDPNTSASYNFSISAEYFKTSSCLQRNIMATKRNIYAFQHPQTNSTRECTSSEMLGFNSKLVCVDGELKTFYYEASDTRCVSNPRAVVASPSCMMDTYGLYSKLSCADSLSVVAVSPPSLDKDSSAPMIYFHTMTYHENEDRTGSCSVLETGQYYSGFPGVEGELLLNFGVCGEFGGGYNAMAGCDEDSGTISMALYRGDNNITCDEESLVVTNDDIYDSGTCMNSTIKTCTSEAPIYEGTIDDWEVLLEYHGDDACSSSTGEEERFSWMEVVDTMDSFNSSLDNDTSHEYYISFDSEEAMRYVSCSTNGMYNTEFNCVDGMLKLVVFSAEDTTCSDTPLMVSEIPSCVEWEDEGEYAKMSCVEEPSDGDDGDDDGDDDGNDDDMASAHHLSKPLWLVGSAVAAVIMALFFKTAGGNF